MDGKQIETCTYNNRLQDMLKTLSKCKVEFANELEEFKNLKETNIKLELELKEARELEKSHRYHLQISREMISSLQKTVSQLVYLKRDVKRLKDEIISKDSTIMSMKKDKENIELKYNDTVMELRKTHESHIAELICINNKKMEQVCNEGDTRVALITCELEELRNKLKETEIKHKDKTNVLVLEYEEKIQSSAAEVNLLREQLTTQGARAAANLDAYRKKLEDLEEKLKQSQFKEYLAKGIYTQNSNSHLENRVERPYCVNQEYTWNSSCFNKIPVSPSPKPTRTDIPNLYSNRDFKSPALQVIYRDNKTPESTDDKKGHFKITKKRKLYTDKDFIN